MEISKMSWHLRDAARLLHSQMKDRLGFVAIGEGLDENKKLALIVYAKRLRDFDGPIFFQGFPVLYRKMGKIKAG